MSEAEPCGSVYSATNRCHARRGRDRPPVELKARRPDVMRKALSACELIVADLLHPVDALSVEGLGDRDVGHRGGGGRAVPVLLAGRNPDHVAGADLLLRAAFALGPAAAGP